MIAPAGGGAALVLAAHGSGAGPGAAAQVGRHVRRLQRLGGFDEVVAAFRHGTPGFDTVLDGLRSRRVVVVPFMTSDGYFASAVLPDALERNRRRGEVTLAFTRPVGTHPRIGAVVAAHLRALLARHGLAPASVTVLVVGHGTPRNGRSRLATQVLASRLEALAVARRVGAAFLDDAPSVEDAARQVPGGNLVVLPFLIGGGSHAVRDLPRRLAEARRGEPNAEQGPILLDRPVGALAGLTNLAAELAGAALGRIGTAGR